MEIEKFIKLLDSVVAHYRAQNVHRKSSEIEDALFILLADKHQFEWRGDLWSVNLTESEAIELLSTFDFSTLTTVIETERDIIPDKLLLSYKVKVKANGLIWIIHRYDPDPFPSNPHAHQLENNLKVDLSNGRCYKGRKHVSTLSRKHFTELRSKAAKVYKGELPRISVD